MKLLPRAQFGVHPLFRSICKTRACAWISQILGWGRETKTKQKKTTTNKKQQQQNPRPRKQRNNRHLGVSYVYKLLWLSELLCVAEPGEQICCVLLSHRKYKCFHLKLSNRVLRWYNYTGFTTGETKRNINWPAAMIQCHVASLCGVGARTCMYFPNVYMHETPWMPKIKCVY